MKIHILTNDGSPLGCSLATLMGTEPDYMGCGGAELALLTMCELWSKEHELVLFNDPRPTASSPFEQRTINSFDPNEKCDVLIVFRSPNHRIVGAKADTTIWWSCDQFTVSDFRAFRLLVDKVVLISPTHDNYFRTNYGITDGIVIDLPVRVWEYENRGIEKVKNRFIFTSVPARGLNTMLEIWPRIKQEIPDASLVITSDYRLWNCGRGNELFMAKAFGLDGVTYLSAVPRPRLVEEQLKAELNVYTCNYEELFCIAIAESQVAGSYTITPQIGALKTTNMNMFVHDDPETPQGKNTFVTSVIWACNEERELVRGFTEASSNKAKARFHPDRILAEWDRLVFNK